jgi:hypothetical protein
MDYIGTCRDMNHEYTMYMIGTIIQIDLLITYDDIIHFNRIFHEINHPAIGDPPFLETPIISWPNIG